MVQPLETSPRNYTKPAADSLLKALDLLADTSFAFGHEQVQRQQTVEAAGVPRYLTSIIASSLDWIRDDEVKERIWNEASLRLSARSGRHAAPSQTRMFKVNETLMIQLHEPCLTGDNLGLKTWASSLLLAKRLMILRAEAACGRGRVLELGAGTGLVGISAACLWGASVVLTDLPDIVPNLAKNVSLNSDLILASGGEADTRALDWSNASDMPQDECEKYHTIIAADPIYSPEHPKMLANAILRSLATGPWSRVVMEFPLREHYKPEQALIKSLLVDGGLSLMAEGVETGYDDWQNVDGTPAEVECWWGVWQWRGGKS
ncbi:hypothetical protein DV737_g3524, partial [Chaetothyriales sp. CBS 132003]